MTRFTFCSGYHNIMPIRTPLIRSLIIGCIGCHVKSFIRQKRIRNILEVLANPIALVSIRSSEPCVELPITYVMDPAKSGDRISAIPYRLLYFQSVIFCYSHCYLSPRSFISFLLFGSTMIRLRFA
jgi:hypothetical protein